MTLIANTGGAIVSALIGALTWLLFAFAGTPIRKFWDLRGEVAQAMNQYARNISEPHGNESLLFAQTVAIVQSRAELGKRISSTRPTTYLVLAERSFGTFFFFV